MVGAMVQGTGASFVEAEVGSGSKSVRAIAASVHPTADALIRITPARFVWWQGWSSGSASA
jgi:hypothetical protein